MADEIRVGTAVDVSGLKSGTEQALAELRKQLAVMQEQYRQASADVRQSVNRIVDAEKQAAEAISAGHVKIAAALQSAVEAEKAELDGLIAKQLEATTATKQLQSAVAEMAGAHAHAVTDVQAASAAIRTFEGAVPIRAVEQFSVKVLGLGPVVQAAFPYIGAFVLGEMVVSTGEKLVTFLEELNPVNKALEEQKEIVKGLDGQWKQLIADLRQVQESNAAKFLGATAGANLKATNVSLIDVTATERAISLLKTEIADLQKQSTEITDSIGSKAGPEAFAKAVAGREKQQALQVQIDTKNKEITALEARLSTQQQKATGLFGEGAQDQIGDNEQAAEKKKAAEQKAAAEHKALIEKNSADIREAYKRMLDERMLDHAVDLDELTAFRQQELAEVSLRGSEYHRLITEVEGELAPLVQRQFAERKREHDEALQEENRQFLENLKATEDHAKRLAQGIIYAAAEEKRARAENRAELVSSSQAESTGRVGDLQVQKAGVQQQQSLDYAASPIQQIEYLKALRDVDQQIIQEKIQQKIREIQIDSLNDPRKAAQDIRQLADIKRAGELQMAQDTTKILTQEQAGYRRLYNEISTGFQHAVSGWVTGQNTLAQGFGQVLQQMETRLISMLTSMGVRWLAYEALTLAAHLSGAAAKKAIDTEVGIKEITINAKKAASGAYNAVVGIPIVGPVLAPIAAATAFTAVEAMAAFETGGYVPRTGVAMLHAGEEVVNSPMRSALQNMLDNGGTGGGDTYNHIHPGAITVNASPGMDPSAIANKVMDQISTKLQRRQAFMAGQKPGWAR